MTILEKGSSDETRIWMGSSEIKGSIKAKVGRVATITVAASTASDLMKMQADFVCTGVDDNIILQQAIDSLPAIGGEVRLSEGTFVLAAQLARAIDNVTISGMGYSTYITYNGTLKVISVGVQAHWVIKDLRTDDGFIDVATAIDWSIINVWRNNFYFDNFSESTMSNCETVNADGVNHKLVVNLDNFEADDWVVTGGTISYDTTIKMSGTRSLKLDIAAGGTATIVKTAALPDLTNCGMSFWAYIPETVNLNTIILSINTGAGNWTNCASGITMSPVLVNGRWIKYVVSAFSSLTGSPVFSDSTRLKFTVSAKATGSTTIYFDNIKFWKRVLTPRGAVTFVFDDGYPSCYEKAAPILYKYGFAGVAAVTNIKMAIPENFEGFSNIQKLGWDITNHSYKHSHEEANHPQTDYLGFAKYLANNGFSKGAKHVVLTYGETTPALYDTVVPNAAIIRGTTSYYSALPELATFTGAHMFGVSSSVATVKTRIDAVKTYGTWMQLILHNIVDSGPVDYEQSIAVLDEVVAYCLAQNVEVLTYTQICNRIKDNIIVTSGTGTIASGQTSVNIRHGFHKVPTRLQITLTSSLGTATSIWISSKDVGSTGNLFTVSINAAAGADVTFDWRAEL